MVFRFLNTEVNSDDGLLPSVKFYHLDEITNENKQELRIWCTEANTGGLPPFMYLLVLTCFGLWYKGAMLQVNTVYGSLSVREIVQVCHQKLAIWSLFATWLVKLCAMFIHCNLYKTCLILDSMQDWHLS